MAETQREYIVGTVRPTNRPEAGQEIDLDEKIPAKIKLITRTMNFTRGTEEEFSTSMPGYEAKAAELAKMNADLVRPSGAPPFMLLATRASRRSLATGKKNTAFECSRPGRTTSVRYAPWGSRIRRRQLFSREDERHLRPLFHRGRDSRYSPWKESTPLLPTCPRFPRSRSSNS